MNDPTRQEERTRRFAEQAAATPTIDEAMYRKRSRRSILTGALGAAGAFVGWRWIQGQETRKRIPGVLRTGHEFNESLWSSVFREDHLAKTFPRSESTLMRVNGRHGIREDLDLATWGIDVRNESGRSIGRNVMEDITAFEKVEMTVEHKCVEGWSHIVTWGGTRFSDFLSLYQNDLGELTDFVSLETPDGDYYVGLDMATMLHPQTLLAYELEGAPLDEAHGAPVRLVTPIKYGIKQIKRIGKIEFTNTQPDDYWGDRGYDWYAAL